MGVNKPIIRWTGGKQQYIQEILSHFPITYSDTSYFEPFVGAGSIFLNFTCSRKFISDINPNLMNMYEQVRINPQKIHNKLVKYNSSYLENPNIYYPLREKFNDTSSNCNITKAALFIFLMQSNFNGIYRTNQLGKYNVPKGKEKPSIPSLSNLNNLKNILTNVNIEVCEYLSSIKRAKPIDIIYIDPPYPKEDWNNLWNLYSMQKFGKEEHETLARNLSTIEARILVSLPNIEFVRKLYSKWNINIMSTNNSELIITNF